MNETIEGLKIILTSSEVRGMLQAQAKRLTERAAAFNDRLAPVRKNPELYQPRAIRSAARHHDDLIDRAKRIDFVAAHLAEGAVRYSIDPLRRKTTGSTQNRFDLYDLGFADNRSVREEAEEDNDALPRLINMEKVMTPPADIVTMSAPDAFKLGFRRGFRADEQDDDVDMLD